jgi:hypothetical protein
LGMERRRQVMIGYRGNDIIGIEVLTGKCEVCNEPATVRVIRNNHTPPTGYMKGGTIASYYCDEHQPNQARHDRDIKNWTGPTGDGT